MGTDWLAQERSKASLQAYNDAIAKERLAAAWSKLYDENERLKEALSHQIGQNCFCSTCEATYALIDGSEGGHV